MAQQQLVQIGFKSVRIFKDQTLGIGSYGKVCKAQCDDLVCAAKLIHETLFDPLAQQQVAPQREHRLPLTRFQQECDFLSSIRHPNIILYLGMHQDGDTGLPVLLMELMDDSLTNFLESSTQPVPYHIQVNICYDVALALSFLHSNEIIHRDLSSNNVLMIGNLRAKVTDFGMARLGDINPHATRFTSTTCPGTDVYMPPEAVKEKPVYTEKIDCFSFGVITLQTLTRLFPSPADRMQEVQLNHPGLPPGTVWVQIPEINRRQKDIDKIYPDHPLLPVVLNCLEDNEKDRPSAEQLCERTASLKVTTQYKDARDSMTSGGRGEAALDAVRSLRVQLEERDRNLIRYWEEIQHLNQDNQQLHRDIQRLEKDKNQVILEKVQQLGRVNNQLEESERVIADFERRVVKLEEQLSQKDKKQITITSDRSGADGNKLRWREGENAPCKMHRLCDAVVGGGVVYCKEVPPGLGKDKIHAYHTTTCKWSLIPQCPVYGGFAIVVINGTLTTVGGFGEDLSNTNKLFSLTGAREDGDRTWTEDFPPMPTKRYDVSVLCIGTALIVVGGLKLETVEIFNTSTRQWHTTTELPQPLACSSMTVCGDRIYLLGGEDKDHQWTQSVYSRSLSTFFTSRRSRIARALSRSNSEDTWTRVADLPVTRSTAVSLHGQLMAVGGKDSDKKPTSDIHRYNPSTNSWEVISHMATPRFRCFAAVLPDNQLMVVGGQCTCSNSDKLNSVEFARVEIY